MKYRPTLSPNVAHHLSRLRKKCYPTALIHQVDAAVDCLLILHYRRNLDDQDVLAVTSEQITQLARGVDPRTRHIGDAIRDGMVPITLYTLTHEKEEVLV